jgi:hypothetical protein
VSSAPKNIYVVMRKSGCIRQMRHSGIGTLTETEGPYLSILSAIADEHQSAGGNYDRPDKLFLNGELVVERGLCDLAWKFRQDELGSREAASRAVKNMHMPAWLPADERKPGYNPPGVDIWTVKKRGAE